MIKKFNSLLLFMIIGSSVLFSQTASLKSVYLSLHSGLFNSSYVDFEKSYESQIGLVYGFGAGLPLSSSTYIYGKATIFSKSGTSTYRIYNDVSSSWDSKEGNADYSQWIINGGMLYNIFINADWTLGLNIGLTYSKISEKKTKQDGKELATKEGSGLLGFFIGSSLEKNFKSSPFSVFVKPQYNISFGNLLSTVGNYGGFNLNIGVRYYFRERRLD